MNKFSKLLATLLFALSFVQAQSPKFPSGFIHEKIAGLDFPVSIAFGPDDDIYLAGQEGKVKLIRHGKIVDQNLIQLDSVYSHKEKGLLDIALDPNFKINGCIYLYYTINMKGHVHEGTTLTGTPVRNKIARYTLENDKVLPNSKKNLLDLDIIPSFLVNFNHDGGTMHFGPDGKLYVAVGENTLWCSAKCFNILSTNSACGPTWIVPTTSQDYGSYHGKLLRIKSDGSAPDDNPYYSAPTPATTHQKYFHAMGLRNPFTFHFKKGTSDIYFNDVGSGGTNQREEINKISKDAGKNFGWPTGEGSINNANYVNPVYAYKGRNCRQVPANSGNYVCDSLASSIYSGCAIVGGVFYQPSKSNWPSEYQNKYFFMDFCNGWINTLDVDHPSVVTNFATSLSGNYTSNSSGGNGSLFLEVSEDGAMYHLTRSQSSGVSGIYRLSYQPITISGLSISGYILTINGCDTSTQLQPQFSPANASWQTLEWEILPKGSLTIDSNMRIHPIRNGVVTISAFAKANYSIKYTFTIEVSGIIVPAALTLSTSTTSDTLRAQCFHYFYYRYI